MFEAFVSALIYDMQLCMHTFLDAIMCCTPNDYMKISITNKLFVNFIERSLNLTSPLEHH